MSTVKKLKKNKKVVSLTKFNKKKAGFIPALLMGAVRALPTIISILDLLKGSGKLIETQGGLIHHVPESALLDQRNKILYSVEEQKYIKLLSLAHDTQVDPIGSISYSIQQYPSDIDLNQVVKIRNYDFSQVVSDLQKVVYDIINSKIAYFSDFKAGVDERFKDDKDKYIIRWNPQEILKGSKVLPGNLVLTLENALKMQSVVKLDVIVYSDTRFVEVSTFFILENIDNKGNIHYINIPDNFYDLFVENLKKDIVKFTTVEPKFFKAVKRSFSLARLNKDMKKLKILEPLIVSNLSLLSQINADIETMLILLEKYKTYPVKHFILAVSGIAKKISTINDLDIDKEYVVKMIQIIYQLLDNKDKKTIKQAFHDLHDYFLNILNSQTSQYIKLKNIKL